MKYKFIFFFIAVFFDHFAIGQECGVTYEDQKSWMEVYFSNKAMSVSQHRSALIYVPVTFHLVARDNGASRASERSTLDVLCELNEIYSSTNIIFYLSNNGIKLANNDMVFNTPYLANTKVTMRGMMDPNSMNVFVVNKVSDNGAVTGFYDKNEDWILLQKGSMMPDNKTLAHEIGHFFSLLHTHFGWESQAWTAADAGKTAASICPDGITPTELVVGGNCYTAGDLLCDTPADYNFGLNWQKSCDFKGGNLDPQGTLVNPDETLLMGYFNDSCRSTLTYEQTLVMHADLESDRRLYLFNTLPGNKGAFKSVPTLMEPIGMQQIDNDSLLFVWENIGEADQYLLEIDRSAQFNLDPKTFLTSKNQYNVAIQWLKGVNYYWRVSAYNGNFTCLGPSPNQTFQVEIASGNTIEKVGNSFFAFQKGNELYVKCFLNINTEAIFKLYDISGKLHMSNKLSLEADQPQSVMDISSLRTGIYVLNSIGKFNFSQKVFISF